MEFREEYVHKEKPNPKPRSRKNINSTTKQDNNYITKNFHHENTRSREQNTYNKKEENGAKFQEGESSEDCNADYDDHNGSLFFQSKRVKENDDAKILLFQSKHVKENDDANDTSSGEDGEKPEEAHRRVVTYSEEKEIKNVRPPPRRSIKDKILFRTKYPDKIEEIQAKATVTLETFKNNSLTEASYQSYKKLLMQARGELKVMKPKNKKERNKLENAVQFTECVMKELDDEFTKYMTSIRSKNK